MHFLSSFDRAADYFWSGTWWWQWKRHRADRRLDRTLEAYRENTFAASRDTHQWEEMDFAAVFCRPAPPLVRDAIWSAAKAGLPHRELQSLVLNQDLRQVGALVVPRGYCWRPALACLSYAGLILAVAHWLLLVALVLVSPAAIAGKTAAVLAVSAIYRFIWGGLGPYGLHAYRVWCRTAPLVASMARARSDASVTTFRNWRNRPPR